MKGGFLIDARILLLLAPTQVICLADRDYLLRSSSPNIKDWKGYLVLLED